MPSKHCYLIICPDPSKNLELQILGTAYATTDSSKAEPGNRVQIGSNQLHFVKFGDEEGTKDRVKQYRTHNPTFWWRSIRLKDATGVDGELGKYLEKLCLKDDRPYGHAEWRAITGYPARLERLCKDLDGITDPNKVWWTSEFKDKAEIDTFFDHVFG